MADFETWDAWIEHWFQYLLETNEVFARSLLETARHGMLMGSAISYMARADPVILESYQMFVLEQEAVEVLCSFDKKGV